MQSIYQKIISNIDNNFISYNRVKLNDIKLFNKGGFKNMYTYISTLKIKNKKINSYKNRLKKIKRYYKNCFSSDD